MRIRDVRFSPNNGHAQCPHQCPLSAISGHAFSSKLKLPPGSLARRRADRRGRIDWAWMQIRPSDWYKMTAIAESKYQTLLATDSDNRGARVKLAKQSCRPSPQLCVKTTASARQRRVGSAVGSPRLGANSAGSSSAADRLALTGRGIRCLHSSTNCRMLLELSRQKHHARISRVSGPELHSWNRAKTTRRRRNCGKNLFRNTPKTPKPSTNSGLFLSVPANSRKAWTAFGGHSGSALT